MNNSPAYETKTQRAFRWTVESIFDSAPRVYFWTFTFRKQMPSFWAAPTWSEFLRTFRKDHIPFRGIRVFEWHKHHGLHIHALVDRRLPVQMVRRVAERYGFGRIHVTRANLGACLYISKYLGKDQGKMPYGGRSWARIGKIGHAVRDIQTTSTDSEIIKAAMAENMKRGLNRRDAYEAAKLFAEMPTPESIQEAVALRNFQAEISDGVYTPTRNNTILNRLARLNRSASILEPCPDYIQD